MEKINFELNGREKKGILIKEEGEFSHVKLDNGYNIIVPKEDFNITKREKLESESPEKQKKQEKKTPRVLILHTGGTIASKVDYSTGAVSSKFTPEEIMDLFPEITEMASIDAKLVFNIASEDMNFAHYNKLIKEISQNCSKYDGIIITHGTDTLHYTSAALHMALKNLPVPVLLIGAQRSSDRPSSDAFLNLVSAIKFIEKNSTFARKFTDIGICMHETPDDEECIILHGMNARKLHTSRRDAFAPVNKEKAGTINYYKDKVSIKEEFTVLNSGTQQKLKYDFYKEDLKIGILKAHPNMFPEEIKAYKNFHGVVLEGTGLGHMPINKEENAEVHEENYKAFRELVENKVILLISSQTIHGQINMNIYSAGRKLKDIGVQGDFSRLTPESAFITLAYALSTGRTGELLELVKKNS